MKKTVALIIRNLQFFTAAAIIGLSATMLQDLDGPELNLMIGNGVLTIIYAGIMMSPNISKGILVGIVSLVDLGLMALWAAGVALMAIQYGKNDCDFGSISGYGYYFDFSYLDKPCRLGKPSLGLAAVELGLYLVSFGLVLGFGVRKLGIRGRGLISGSMFPLETDEVDPVDLDPAPVNELALPFTPIDLPVDLPVDPTKVA